GGNELPAVGAECHTFDDVPESAQAMEFLAGADVPDSHFTLLAASEALPIGAEGDAPEALGVGESEELFARVDAPELHATVVRDRGQPLAVGMESDTEDAGRVDAKREWFFVWLLFQGRGVPDPDSPVPGRG